MYLRKREGILQRHSAAIDCECGMHYTFGHKSWHKKSLYHRNYMTLLQLVIKKTGETE
jgi:hypothetical protein